MPLAAHTAPTRTSPTTSRATSPHVSPVAPTTATPSTDGSVDLDHAVQVFLAQRTQLFRVAYRVTGDVAHAEDVVQEAWLRWQRADRSEIRNPAAFLTTATTHLAINLIQTARHRHETPAEPPLADLVDVSEDPAQRYEHEAAVREGLALLLRRLTRPELTAYLLRKSFDYAYADIAALLRTTGPNARQLVRRAQVRLEKGIDRALDLDADYLASLASAFRAAATDGELRHLERVLCGDVPPTSACRGTRRLDPCRHSHRPALPRTA